MKTICISGGRFVCTLINNKQQQVIHWLSIPTKQLRLFQSSLYQLHVLVQLFYFNVCEKRLCKDTIYYIRYLFGRTKKSRWLLTHTFVCSFGAIQTVYSELLSLFDLITEILSHGTSTVIGDQPLSKSISSNSYSIPVMSSPMPSANSSLENEVEFEL